MSTELLSRLDDWARERQISPKEFDCPHYEKCNSSLQELGLHLERGHTCTMSYLGKEYGESELAPGKPFRLAIVGIDPGATYEEEELGGFIESQRGIEKWYYGTETKFNQHYRGVIRTASAILGAAGKHCLDHCYLGWRCVGDKRPNGEPCVLRLFAQPNLVKCAPAENENMQTKSTDVMFENCAQHLLSEVEALKPDLVVFHGKRAQSVFPVAIDGKGYKHTALSNSPKDGNFPMVHEVIAPDGNLKFFALYLKHPSHGWLDSQWDQERTVEPAFDLLRSKGAIPQ